MVQVSVLLRKMCELPFTINRINWVPNCVTFLVELWREREWMALTEMHRLMNRVQLHKFYTV